MKALRWYGRKDVRVEEVADPKIINPRDAIIRVTATAICGSDLHIYNGLMPTMKEGDILGHEFMGEVVEVGKENKKLKVGDRVVVPFTISCGHCFFCQRKMFSLCDCSNPNKELAVAEMGHSPAALFGFSHMLGGYAGGQAELVRVPFADIGPIKIEDNLKDEKVLFLSDILPTGYMAAENGNIQAGDTVVVWGCGPVGQFAIQSAWLLGAERVIAIDSVVERLEMAEKLSKAEAINFEKSDVYEHLMVITKGRGPDVCIDAVGTEAHCCTALKKVVDKTQHALHLEGDKPYVLQEMIKCCRKGGTLSIPGVYLNKMDIPFGAAMNKGLSFKMGQTHVQHYLKPLLKKIKDGKINPAAIITHRINLKDAPEAYKIFNDKKDSCIKVVMKP